MKKLFLALLLSASPAFAALSSTIEWEVRTTGNNANGGGFKPGASGTDYSQQNSAQYALTSIATAGTGTTFLTATAASNMVGNTLQVISGTNFVTGFFEITSVSAGVSVTVDRNICTGVGASGVINIGGGLLTPQKGNDAAVNSNTVWIKSGTYTQTTSIVWSNTGGATSPKMFRGYDTTHGDSTTRPLITTATDSTKLCDVSGVSGVVWRNINFSNTASTRSRCFSTPSDYCFWLQFTGCKFTGFTEAIEFDNIIDYQGTATQVNSCEFTSISAYCIRITGTLMVRGSFFHDCTGTGIFSDGPASIGSVTVLSSAFRAMNYGIDTDSGTDTRAANVLIFIDQCDFADSVNDDIRIQNTTRALSVTNSIGYNNGTGGAGKFINAPNQLPGIWVNYNAYASGDLTNVTAGNSDVTITGDPFTNRASNDFSLNNTAGAGAACRNAGFPSATGPGLFGAGYQDIGALRHQDTGGSSITSHTWGG